MALVIGSLTFIMAVPPFLQMIWERPKIELKFDVTDLEEGRILECQIYNHPITNKILRILNIKRMTADDIVAHFSIEEYGTRKVILPGTVPQIITYAGPAMHRISLPPSAFPAKFGIVTVAASGGKVTPCEEGTKCCLKPGKFLACVEVVESTNVVRKQQAFVVTKTHPFAYWSIN